MSQKHAVGIVATSFVAGLLELEIQEEELRRVQIHRKSILDGICRLGVGLTLDDFGRGTTPLSILSQGHVKRVKIHGPRVREALGYAFDFEWTNKNLFFSLYKRTDSFFVNSDMVATGKPSAAELELLNPFKDILPGAVFGEAFVPPVSDGSGRDRKLLRAASKLLNDAGFKIKDRKATRSKSSSSARIPRSTVSSCRSSTTCARSASTPTSALSTPPRWNAAASRSTTTSCRSGSRSARRPALNCAIIIIRTAARS